MAAIVFLFIFLLLAVAAATHFKTHPCIDLGDRLDDVHAFIERNGGSHLSHLIFLNDKEIYQTSNQKALFVYKKIGSKVFVLGDPIGKEEFFKEALAEFQSYCKTIHKTPVFYQVSETFLPYCFELNYQTFKLGEEAKVNLQEFSLSGKKWAKLRTRKNKFEKNGFQFQVSIPPHSKDLLEKAEAISSSWLGHRKEKGYSVGFFSQSYLSHFPISFLTNPDGEIIAFASLACDKQKESRTITIDLMRYIADCPHGTMDFLFLSTYQWCKESGYNWCSLGMSPLANVGISKYESPYEKIGRFVFEYGHLFYKFKGLHEFKNKYGPQWESRYLVYQKSFLPFLFLQLIILIHQNKHTKQVLGKLSKGLKTAG